MSNVVPPGYRFKPTDEVITKHYLIPKIEGKPLPSYHIYETGELYGKDSLDLEETFRKGKERYKRFASYDENSDDSLYFFTKLTKKWENGSRISRTAGGGTWTGDNRAEEIYRDPSYIVKKRNFTFTDNAVKNSKKKMTTLTSDGNSVTWKMDEYSILKGEEMLDYAIVKIRRKRSKKECSSSSSSKRASSSSSRKASSCNNHEVKGGQDDSEVHNAVPEVPAAEVSHNQYQPPYYVNTNYHTAWDNGAGCRGFQHWQNSSIGDVVPPVLPAAESNHMQYQPSSSTTFPDIWWNNVPLNEQAACVQSFSYSSLLQDVMLSTQDQLPSNPSYNNTPNYQGLPSVADTCYQYPVPSGYQHLSANSLGAAVEPVAADDSVAIGGVNAAAQDHNKEGTSDTLMTNSEVEAQAMQPQNKLGENSDDEELISNVEFVMSYGLF